MKLSPPFMSVKKVRYFLTVILLVLSIFSLNAKEMSLQFKKNSIVNDSLIRLEDIAIVHGSNPLSVRSLQSVVIGKSAPPGYSRLVNVDDIVTYYIKSYMSDISIVPVGSKKISVRTDAMSYNVLQFQNKITAYLDSSVSWKKGNWTFEIQNSEQQWLGYKLPYTSWVSGLKSGKSKGKVTLILNFSQGHRIKKIPIVCMLTVRAPVIVARRDIVRRSALSADDYEISTVDITRFAPEPCTDPKELIGVETKMSIKAGTIIHTHMIKQLPDVVRGETIVIMYAKGRITCTIRGIAREHGVTGDKIWVENSITKKLLRVVIVGKGRAALV